MIEVIYLGSVFCALLTVYVLLLREGALRSYADYLLSIFFIFEAWAVIMYLLIYSGWLINVPHLYKSAAPFNFLFPVLTYLYVRSVLYNEKSFAKKDIWHLIPFLFFTLNYLPFFLLPINEKRLIVIAASKDINLTYKYNAGIIPESLTYIFRTLQTLIYLIFQWRLILKYNKENQNSLVENQIKAVVKWLKIFTWASTLFVIAFVGLTVLAMRFNTIFITGIINYLPGLLISASFLVISSYLVAHPTILAGLPFIKYKDAERNVLNEEVAKLPFIEEDYTLEIAKIDNYFKVEQPFLNKNLTIGHISIALNVSNRELSYIINNYYRLRFNDFINKYRIEYIIHKYQENQLNHFTIESIAFDAGFKSRSTFYNAFNKIYNMTPSEYFAALKAN